MCSVVTAGIEVRWSLEDGETQEDMFVCERTRYTDDAQHAEGYHVRRVNRGMFAVPVTESVGTKVCA